MISHTPRKSLGQHFLHDKEVIQRIVRNFNARPGDTVVEIGPGLGALTFELVSQVEHLHVVEMDNDLAAALSKMKQQHKSLHVHNGDALKTDFCSLTGAAAIRIIGNLPYNISTPLLFHLIDQRDCVRDMCVMLQKEVGQRIQAKTGTKQYGRLSVMIQQACRTELVAHVHKGAFTPAPRVDSVVLNLIPYQEPPHPVTNPRAFEQVVRVAFSQRRKTLRNALKSLIDDEQMKNLHIDPKLRPEQLDVRDFVQLSGLL